MWGKKIQDNEVFIVSLLVVFFYSCMGVNCSRKFFKY